MFRLRHVIAMMANAVLVGGLLIFVLAMGWVGWLPVTGAILLGFALTWPVGRFVARCIKADDPAWNEVKDRPTRAAMKERLETALEDRARRDSPDPL